VPGADPAVPADDPSPPVPAAGGGASVAPAAPPAHGALDAGPAGQSAAAAAETVPAPPALAALPPVRGGGGIPPEYEGYVRALRQRIQERLVYPQVAVRRRVAGAIELEVELDAGGRLVSVGSVDRAGAAVLREAAVRAVRDATPFPFPAHLVPRALLIRLPVVFELR
jgi:TonB family protein